MANSNCKCNGPGIEPAKASTGGIGIPNTRARLDKLYGSAHAFHLSPVNGGGLRVTVILPFHTAGNGEKSNGKD